MTDFREREPGSPDALRAGTEGPAADAAHGSRSSPRPSAPAATDPEAAGDPTAAMEELLRTLSLLPGPTGQEDEVLAWVRGEWEGRGEVTQSPVGNLYLHIPGPGPRVLLAAHADEL